MKIILMVLVALLYFTGAQNSFSQKGSRSSGSSYKSSTSYKYKSPTYDVGGTKYKSGESYKTTGMPKVERSSSAKREFLDSRGLEKTPKGYEIDHVVPLSKGGADRPYNMQLLPKEVHKQKTASERKRN